jgi:hypothetical protein
MSHKNVMKILLACSLAVFLTGCQSAQQPTESAAGGGTTTAGGSARRRAGGGAASKAASQTESAAAAASQTESVTVPAGTTLEVRLVNALDTGSTPQGSSFEATLAAPLVVNGRDVAPVGSTATGTVENVVSSGRLNRPAELSLTLASLEPKGGEKVAISTSTVSMKGESHKKRDIEMIGGGAAVGALVGAIAGGKKGAAIGTVVGGGGGTGAAAYTGKKEIHLAPETKLAFKLSEPVTFTVSK